MHPGNILVRVPERKPSNNQLFSSRPHVIFLDVGMTAELSKRDRTNILDFFKAVALRDGRTASECMLRLSKQQNCPNPKAFIEVKLSAYLLQMKKLTLPPPNRTNPITDLSIIFPLYFSLPLFFFF